MTTPDPIPSGAAVAAPPEQIAALHRDLDRLLIALAAVKMAIDATREVSSGTRIGENVTEQTVHSWLATTLLVRTDVQSLYNEALDLIAGVRLMLPPSHP